MYIQFPFTLRQFLIFKIVVIKQNFTKASRLLYISQPTISKQLTKLEKDCNMIFLKYKNKNFFLTKDGQIFYQYIERILYICEESYRILKEIKIGDRESLKLGVTSNIALYLIPQLILIFTKTYPRLIINIQVNSTIKILEDLSKNNIDIALTENNISKMMKNNFKYINFIKDEFVLMVPFSHPLTLKKKISKLDLYQLNFINLNSSYMTKKALYSSLYKNNIKNYNLKVVATLNSIEDVKNAVSLGLGVSFIPSLFLQKELKFERIRIVQIKDIQIYRKLIFTKNISKNSSKSIRILQYEFNHLKKKIESRN